DRKLSRKENSRSCRFYGRWGKPRSGDCSRRFHRDATTIACSPSFGSSNAKVTFCTGRKAAVSSTGQRRHWRNPVRKFSVISSTKCSVDPSSPSCSTWSTKAISRSNNWTRSGAKYENELKKKDGPNDECDDPGRTSRRIHLELDLGGIRSRPAGVGDRAAR